MKAVHIHLQISEVYGENTMSDGIAKKMARTFKDGHNKELNGRPSIINEENS